MIDVNCLFSRTNSVLERPVDPTGKINAHMRRYSGMNLGVVYEKNRAVYSCRDRVKFDIQHESQMQKVCVASPCIFMIKQGSFAFQECGLARWSQTTSRAVMR